jgi:hypothetical protein
MHARVDGLTPSDDIEVSLLSPRDEILITRKVQVRAEQAGDTYLYVGKRQAVWSSWELGRYIGRVRVMRNGVEMLRFSSSLELR